MWVYVTCSASQTMTLQPATSTERAIFMLARHTEYFTSASHRNWNTWLHAPWQVAARVRTRRAAWFKGLAVSLAAKHKSGWEATESINHERMRQVLSACLS